MSSVTIPEIKLISWKMTECRTFFQLHFCLRVHYPVVLLSQLCTILAYCPRIQLLYCLCPGYLLPLFRSATGRDTAHREFGQGKASCMHCLCPLTNCSWICSKFHSTLRSTCPLLLVQSAQSWYQINQQSLCFPKLSSACLYLHPFTRYLHFCARGSPSYTQGQEVLCHRKLLQSLQKQFPADSWLQLSCRLLATQYNVQILSLQADGDGYLLGWSLPTTATM